MYNIFHTKVFIITKNGRVINYFIHNPIMIKTIVGLQDAKDEMGIRHHFACTWFIPFSSVDSGSRGLLILFARQILWLKLTGHVGHTFLDDGNFDCLEGYETAYYRLPMKLDGTIVGKTLESYQPCFIQNMLDWDPHNPKQLDHHQARDKSILLEQLFLTLKRCFPSFKFASGVDFGDQIDILHVINSKGTENKSIKTSQGTKPHQKERDNQRLRNVQCLRRKDAQRKANYRDRSFRVNVGTHLQTSTHKVARKRSFEGKCKSKQGE